MANAQNTAIETGNKNKWAGGRSPFNISYGKIMMWIFLLTDTLTFGAFLASMGSQRFNYKVWPDPNHVFNAVPCLHGVNAPLVFVSFMTFVLILSSVTMVLAVHAGHYKDRKAVQKWLLLTIIGGIIFLGCQAWEWTHLYQEGAWWGSFTNAEISTFDKFFNTSRHNVSTVLAEHPQIAMDATHSFFNFFFTITGFHGFHVTIGVILLIIALVNTSANNTYEKRGHYEMIEKIGLYWHFVDLVWVFVFTAFYLL